MEILLLELVQKYPLAVSALAIVGACRAVFKPLFAVLHAYVDATANQKDNLVLEKVEASAVYKGFAFVLDYAASIKLQK